MLFNDYGDDFAVDFLDDPDRQEGQTVSATDLNTQTLHQIREEFDTAEGLFYTRTQGQLSFTWDRLDRVLSSADRLIFRGMRLQGVDELQVGERTYRIRS